MTAPSGHRLLINRSRIAEARLGPDPDAPAARALASGQARLAVERFALTANNITYAAFGEAMKYWQFFPSGDAAWACLPVWGFATIVESQAAGLDRGRRVWGCWPAGTHLIVEPARVSSGGFVDGAAHRRELAPVYSQYAFCDADPGWRPEREALQAVLRPLFATSFLIDRFLADQRCFGAQQVLLSSASSKTAMGTAHVLSQRRGTKAAARVVGLTSPAHAGFTRSLGCYDEVLDYDALQTLSPHEPTVYVDFSGDAELRRRIHTHFGERLAYSCSVGGTHWQALGSARDLPGPRPTLFFAPDEARRLAAPPPDGWGSAELQRRIGEAWTGFIDRVQQSAWVEVVEQRGAAAALQAYQQMLAGRADARQGLVLSLSD